MITPKTGKSVSVIVPVFKEEERIKALISHLRDIARKEPVEIIVVDADPEGSTIKKIPTGEAVTIISEKGRGVQMNRGAEAAEGEILMFLHADTFLPAGIFTSVRESLSEEKYIGGALDLGIMSDNFLLKLTAFFASIKHRITRVPYGDQAIFIRTEFFRSIGGYREIPLFEDVDLMRRIKKLKKKIIILKLKTLSSPRKWERDGIIFTIFRNWTLQALHLLGVSPEFLEKFYYRDKR